MDTDASPELRRGIYGLLLITEDCQPGVSRDNERYLSNYPPKHKAISAQILQVSKAIRDEATSIFYSSNTFTTVAIDGLEWHHVHRKFLEVHFHDYVNKHPQEYPAEMSWEQRVSAFFEFQSPNISIHRCPRHVLLARSLLLGSYLCPIFRS